MIGSAVERKGKGIAGGFFDAENMALTLGGGGTEQSSSRHTQARTTLGALYDSVSLSLRRAMAVEGSSSCKVAVAPLAVPAGSG